MPSYDTEFSEPLTHISPEERRWLEEHLAQIAAEAGEVPFEYAFQDEWDGTTSFWFHSDEQLAEELPTLLQAFLGQFRPTEYLCISYAQTCSRPAPGEFGGGRVFIAADRVVPSDLDAWEREQAARFHQASQPEGDIPSAPLPAEPTDRQRAAAPLSREQNIDLAHMGMVRLGEEWLVRELGEEVALVLVTALQDFIERHE